MAGKIIAISPDTIDVKFTSTSMPSIGIILKTDSGAVLSTESILEDMTIKAVVLKQTERFSIGEKVTSTKKQLQAPVGKEALGRVFNVLGEPLDKKPLSENLKKRDVSVFKKAEKGFSQKDKPLITGIKAIDFFLPIVEGDKIGLFGGAGVGKTLVIKELINNVTKAKNQKDSVSILTGIGERSREGEELYRELTDANLIEKVMLYFAQMNETPGSRMKIIYPAITSAEYFRDEEKKNVLMFIDNIYRFTQAGSELSSSLGRIPSQSGYQPTLMTEISNVQERLSNSKNGSITSFQTVFVPADDITDPATVAVFSHLDSSLVLDRRIAAAGRYPAIDPLQSSSNNIQASIIGERHASLVVKTKKILQRFEDLEDLLAILGTDGVSEEDLKIVEIARQLQAYFTQNFFIAEEFTQAKGDFIELEKNLNCVERIIKGDFLGVAPANFLYISSLKKVEAIKKEIEKSNKKEEPLTKSQLKALAREKKKSKH